MNPSRLTFILSHLPNPPPPPGTLTSGTASFKVHNSSKPLSENPKPLKWLEVGPGGGILISSLLRLGLPPSSITACEPSPELCALIKSRNRDLSDVRNGFVEDVVCDLEVYDVVTLLEVIEHVDAGDRRGMIEKVCGCLGEGGTLFVSTVDRDLWTGYVKGVFGAEVVTGVVERGTHDYGMFVKPKELVEAVRGGVGEGWKMEVVGMGRMVVEGGLMGEVEAYGIRGKGGVWKVEKEEEIGDGWGNYIMAWRKVRV